MAVSIRWFWFLAITCGWASSVARADDATAVQPLPDDPARLVALLSDRDPSVQAAGARVVAVQATRNQAAVYPNPIFTGAIGGIVAAGANARAHDAEGRAVLHEAGGAVESLLAQWTTVDDEAGRGAGAGR